jgi:hypothetical protein
MKRDVGDILDRWSIAKLKFERIGTVHNKREFHAFEDAIKEVKKQYKKLPWGQICEMMCSINDFIWQLEAGLKGGKEELKNPHYLMDVMNTDTLAKIGTTTILIRNFNHLRVDLKNVVNTLTNTGFLDKKKDHLSEER